MVSLGNDMWDRNRIRRLSKRIPRKLSPILVVTFICGVGLLGGFDWILCPTPNPPALTGDLKNGNIPIERTGTGYWVQVSITIVIEGYYSTDQKGAVEILVVGSDYIEPIVRLTFSGNPPVQKTATFYECVKMSLSLQHVYGHYILEVGHWDRGWGFCYVFLRLSLLFIMIAFPITYSFILGIRFLIKRLIGHYNKKWRNVEVRSFTVLPPSVVLSSQSSLLQLLDGWNKGSDSRSLVDFIITSYDGWGGTGLRPQQR